MRRGAWLTAITLLSACACACASAPRPPDAFAHIVEFELFPDAAGKLHRIVVSRVVDRRSDRTVIGLPPASFVDSARNTLAERTWGATYERGVITPVIVRCAASTGHSDQLSCNELAD